MFKPTFYQRVARKMQKSLAPILIPFRRRLLKNDDFTIISNNCWGGICYEYFGMQKKSPTVGMWFFAEDYLKFVKNLKYYTSLQLKIIHPEQSKNYDKLVKMGSESGLVGVLGDIEIILLHYHDPKVAVEKWNRRIERINWNNLIIKFSYMNECTYDMLKEFDELDLSDISSHYKKIMFVPRKMPEFNSAVYIKGFEEEKQITNDTFLFNQYFKLIPFINDEGLVVR